MFQNRRSRPKCAIQILTIKSKTLKSSQHDHTKHNWPIKRKETREAAARRITSFVCFSSGCSISQPSRQNQVSLVSQGGCPRNYPKTCFEKIINVNIHIFFSCKLPALFICHYEKLSRELKLFQRTTSLSNLNLPSKKTV